MLDWSKPISGELSKLRDEIEAVARRYGLDFYPVIFEICDYDTINILAAQGGFPSRYPHWRFGMEFDQLSKGYTYGLQKIYEMVINTNPVYAYLLKGNHLVDQKMVMAHVFGHADFFKHNAYFKNTDRRMMDVMANHGSKIRRYMELYGQDKVEILIDRALSLENLLDLSVLFESPDSFRGSSRNDKDKDKKKEDESEASAEQGVSSALRSYMKSKERIEKDRGKEKKVDPDELKLKKFPAKPVRDILLFIAEHAPLEEWESDVVSLLREEAYYFLPQRLTKIMNEGWASYWHSTIMTKNALRAEEIVDFADHHAGVMAMSKKNINPYKIGIELFRDIEYRWDTGKFGKDYIECDNMAIKAGWDKNLGLGREKIFEVRAMHNDISFIDEFFTQEFCERQQLFTYKFNPRSGRFEIDGRDFLAIKQKLLGSLTNFGQPLIEIIDANFNNRGELLLGHRHQGVDLDMQFADQTMRNLYALWKRPVNLSTRFDDKETLFSFNGKELKPIK